MNIAIIPARFGSKRLQKKYKKFYGKPIISYSIEVQKKAKIFDKILVSTDSVKLKNIAEKIYAEVPLLRPAKISDDKSHLTKLLFILSEN